MSAPEQERPCAYCGHPFSMHFSDDARGLGSKDSSEVHRGCSFLQPDGSACPCPGFAASLPESGRQKTGAGIT
jgi:hypothetical protein